VRFLVDTNVVSEVRKRERADPNVLRWASRTPREAIGTSVLVLAELRRGIELKRRRDPGQARSLDRWYETIRAGLADRVIPVDEPIAEMWGRLESERPLAFVDGILAATALVRGLVLVTRNAPDFANTGVEILDPFAPA